MAPKHNFKMKSYFENSVNISMFSIKHTTVYWMSNLQSTTVISPLTQCSPSYNILVLMHSLFYENGPMKWMNLYDCVMHFHMAINSCSFSCFYCMHLSHFLFHFIESNYESRFLRKKCCISNHWNSDNSCLSLVAVMKRTQNWINIVYLLPLFRFSYIR